MDLAEKINHLMKTKGIRNAKELSEKMHELDLSIPYTTLLTIINGEVTDIKLNTANKFKQFFNITLDELLDDRINITEFKIASHNGINLDGLDETDIKEIDEYIEFRRNKKKNK